MSKSRYPLINRETSLLLAAFFLIALSLALSLFSWSGASAGEGEPGVPEETVPAEAAAEAAAEAPAETPSAGTVTPTPLIDPRQEQPLLPENPSLADLGHQTWWGVCMACHGDAGQGLTDEWRQTAFGEDKDCWTSKCHGKLHPPQGFEFPRIVPPAWGPGTLKRFVTADELHAYLLEKMPWWDPGSLTDQKAWELTAFILRGNGVLSPNQELDIASASLLPVHLPIRTTEDERGWGMVILGVLGLAGIGLIAMLSFRKPAEQAPRSDRRPSFFHHLHPPTIPLPQARLRYTLGMGGLAVFLTLVLVVTGILETYFYIPTPEGAGISVQEITFLVPFGALVRGIHFWAAQALVIASALHLLRVVLTGGYAQPRRLNFLIGLGLFVLALLLDFTGYVLRWDEGIRWALMVGTNLLKSIPLIGTGLYRFVIGGESPGAPTLIRFYAWHLFGLMIVMTVLVGWHIFRVRRDGGIAAPPPELRADKRRISRDELVRREVLAMVIAAALLVLIAALVPAPLEPPIEQAPTAIAPDVRAPWFFLWVQQLLRYGEAFWMGVGLPLILLGVLAALPYLFPHLADDQRGRWLPKGGRIAQLIGIAVVLVWLALTVLELLN